MKQMRRFKEDGMVLAKFNKAAFAGGVIDGKEIKATDEKWFLFFVTGEEFDPVNGYAYGSTSEFAVPKEIYDKTSFGDAVRVKYEMIDSGGQNRPRTNVIEIEVLKKSTK